VLEAGVLDLKICFHRGEVGLQLRKVHRSEVVEVGDEVRRECFVECLGPAIITRGGEEPISCGSNEVGQRYVRGATCEAWQVVRREGGNGASEKSRNGCICARLAWALSLDK